MNIMNSMRKLKKKKDKSTDKAISKRVIKPKKNKSEKSCRSSRKKKAKEPSRSERKKKTKSKAPLAITPPEPDVKTDQVCGGADNFRDIFDVATFAFKNEQSFEPTGAEEKQTPTQRKAFDAFCRYAVNVGVEGLIREYEQLVIGYMPTQYARTIFDQNTALKKNRYKDVICNDLTRVVLKDAAQRPGDYIHANYVKGITPMLILTQGPVKDSIADFWRMCGQETCQLIVMLCELVENGKKKCVPYFSPTIGQAMQIGTDFQVTTENVEQLDSHTVATTICVVDRLAQKSVRLTHLKIVTWPDKTVAKSNLSILRTLRHVRQQQSPVVVHCSAGIGRTGTFAAIEIGIQLMLNGKTNVRTCDIVRALRHCRVNSVQMDTQFLMLTESLIDCARSFKYIDDTQLWEQIDKFKADVAKYVQEHPPPPEKEKKASKENVTNEETQMKTQNEAGQQQVAAAAAATPTTLPPATLPISPPVVTPPVATPLAFEAPTLTAVEKRSTMTQPQTVGGGGGAPAPAPAPGMTTMTQITTYAPK